MTRRRRRSPRAPRAAAAISSDGRYIAFVSDANNFGPTDTNGAPDVYRLDRQTGTFQLVDVGPDSQQADAGAATCGGCVALSNDGRYVAFISQATNLTGLPTNQTYQVYVRDMTQGITTMVSQAAGGGGGDNSSGVVGQAQGFPISMSSDGRYVAFSSQASDLVVGAGGNLRILAYARDVVSGKTAAIRTTTRDGRMGARTQVATTASTPATIVSSRSSSGSSA